MGNEGDKGICIYFLGDDHGFYEKIFTNINEIIHKTKKGDIKILEGKNIKSLSHKDLQTFINSQINIKIEIKLTGYKYPKLSKENGNNIIFDVYNSIKNSENKKNIIICFDKNFIKSLSNLNNKIETDKPFMLFHFSNENEIKNDIFTDFTYPQYISYFIASEEKEYEKFFIKVISFILEKGCYYLEEGNKLNKYLPNNILFKQSKGFIYLNILLTGESRAGKSCFINRIMNKLVSFESSKLESSTLKINSYELYPSEEDAHENKLKSGYGGIKIYDTPGLVKTNNLNSFQLIKEELSKISNEIHIIYFFIKAQGNLEQCIDMLKYIKDLNNQRISNHMNKIPILFIKNGEDLRKEELKPIIFEELQKELKKYDLIDLYDSSINIKNDKKEYDEDNFFDEEENNNNNYDNYINGNIIQVHIPTGKNINKIFSKTKEYIINNNNSLYTKEFTDYKNYSTQLIKYFIKEKLENKYLSEEESKEYYSLYDISIIAVKDFKNNNSLFYNLDILNIKSKGKKNIGIIGSVLSYPFIFLFGIGTFFFAGFMYLYENNIINNIALKYGFSQKDLFEYGLNNYIFEEKEEKEQKEEKDFDFEKFEKKYKEFFEKIIYYIGPIQCLIKSKELFFQIINLLSDLSKRKEEEWNKFQVEQI